MPLEIGQIEAIYRYPVKSMRGEQLHDCGLGFHGIEGDRRFALRRLDAAGGFPWLTASKLAELVSFTPVRRGGDDGDALPTHVRTPEGQELSLLGEALAAEVQSRYGAPVQMMHLKHGIFDEASVSVITTTTVAEICRIAACRVDVRRFRPNVVLRCAGALPFEEDRWIGGVLTFGEANDAPAISLTLRDERCAMVNIDPDGGSATPSVLKACVQANQNYAGAYGTVTRIGRLAVGQTVRFEPHAR